MKKFTSHGREYEIDTLGVVHQTDAVPYKYDKDYVATYDTEEYRKQNEVLQALRLGFVIGAHGSIPRIICDTGYGNGAFLKAASIIPIRYGKDVTGVQVEGVKIVNEYVPADVYTFWDVLEHIPDLSFIRGLPCETIVVSLPWCHLKTFGELWFSENYRHRKPDEHIHHFDPGSLERTMGRFGWDVIAWSSHEDIVRKGQINGVQNILSMAFKRGRGGV